MPGLVPISWLAPTYTRSWVIPRRLESWPFLLSPWKSRFLGGWTPSLSPWLWERSLRLAPLSHSDVHPRVSLKETREWQVSFPSTSLLYRTFFPSITVPTLRFSPSLSTSQTKAEPPLRPRQNHETTSHVRSPGGSAQLPMCLLDYCKLNFRVSEFSGLMHPFFGRPDVKTDRNTNKTSCQLSRTCKHVRETQKVK